MNGELIWVLSLLAVAIVLFATGRVRMDAVALFVIVAFALSGTLTVPEVFSGFSDPNVVLIAALFIIGDGLVRTGVATVMGTWLVKVAGNSEIKMLVLLMLTVAGLGAFMSSTGVVAIFIPVVLSVAMRMQTSPSRLMMPLSFAGLISGMMTLVATPPNLVVNSELLREGYHGFSFFSVTPIGLVVLVLGILYMLVMRFMLKGDTQTPQREGWTRRTFRDLIREYRLTGRARRLAIRPGSPMIGQRLDDLKLRERYGANVIGVERWRRFRRVIVNVNGVSEFRARDVLLIDMSAADVDLRQFCSEQLLEPMVLRGEYFSDQALDVGMAEISLIPESELIGKSVREIGFRTRYGLNVVGLKRNVVALEGSLADEPLLLGDIIIEKTALTINLPQATRRDVSGRMIVNGRVKGYIQGEIDAEIKGSFSGSMQASFESRLPIGGKETELVMEQEGLTQPDDAAKPDTAAQPDDVSQPNTAAQPGEQDAKKEDSDEEQNEQL